LVLVVVGVGISFIPNVLAIVITPDLVLIGFLPPLLYAAAIRTSLVDFRANRRAIGLLSVGLVAFSTITIGLVSWWVVPGISLAAAFAAAEAAPVMVTIGISPTEPATGFGYIHAGQPMGDSLEVLEFVEKPPLETAQKYLASGGYYWNLAMFCWRAATFVDELRRVAPAHYEGLQAVREGRGQYADLPNQAVDYAVMEKTDRLTLIPATFGWRDVGSWSELLQMRDQDGAGNSVDGDAALIETSGSLISAPGKLVAVIGVADLVVIDTDEALLVVPRSRVQEVKQLVELLRATGRTKYL